MLQCLGLIMGYIDTGLSSGTARISCSNLFHVFFAFSRGWSRGVSGPDEDGSDRFDPNRSNRCKLLRRPYRPVSKSPMFLRSRKSPCNIRTDWYSFFFCFRRSCSCWSTCFAAVAAAVAVEGIRIMWGRPHNLPYTEIGRYQTRGGSRDRDRGSRGTRDTGRGGGIDGSRDHERAADNEHLYGRSRIRYAPLGLPRDGSAHAV